jgi:Zn-dependent protease with chaperone function
MQLAILTAVLAAIATAEAGGGPVDDVSWRLVAIFAAALAAPLFALAARHRLSRSLSSEEQDQKNAARLETAVIAVWLFAVAFTLLVGQWPRIVRANWELAKWPLLDEIAILIPVIAPLVLIWAAMFRWEQSDLVDNSPGMTLSSYLLLQTRHHLALVLLPPLLVVGVVESIAALKIAEHLDTVWWFIAPQLAIVLVLMPLAVRRIWRTTPLRVRPLRGMLDEICRVRGVTVREILVWQTNGTMANAAVVGISRFLRYLLLTDVLLCQLSNEQVSAVVRHELGHLRRWHLPLRMAMLLLPIVGWLAIKQAFPEVEPQIAGAMAATGVSAGSHMSAAMLPLALLVYAVVAVGWYSQLLEHDADIDACLDDQGRFDNLACHHFCTALMMLCGDSQEGWFSRWLHPSVSARVGLLNRISEHPEVARQWRRKTYRVAVLLAVLYMAAAVTLVL